MGAMKVMMLCAALFVALAAVVDGAPVPAEQVAANAKFANNAIEHIRAVQADLDMMKKDEQKEMSDAAGINKLVKAVPNAAPGKFAEEEKALGAQARLIEQGAAKGVSLERAQQKSALAALAKSNSLIKNFAAAGLHQELGEAAPGNEIAQQAANAKAALAKVKEVSSALSTGVKTSHTMDLFTAVDKEAKLLESEASAKKLGETLDSASPLSVDARNANFNTAMSTANKAAEVAMAKQNAKVTADKAAVAAAVSPKAHAEHKKLLKKETAQLDDILKKTGQATANEKAAVDEVSSLWQKLN